MKINVLKRCLNVINVLLVSLSLIIVSFPVEAKSRKSNSHARSYKVKKTSRSSSRRAGKRVRAPRTKLLRKRTTRIRPIRAKRAVSSSRRAGGAKTRKSNTAIVHSRKLRAQALAAPFVFTPLPITLQPIEDYWSAENIALREAERERGRLAIEEVWRQQAEERPGLVQARQEAAQRVYLPQVQRGLYDLLAKAEYKLKKALARLDRPQVPERLLALQVKVYIAINAEEQAQQRVIQHELEAWITPEDGRNYLEAARRNLERSNEARRQAPARQQARSRRAIEKAVQAETAQREETARIDEARREREENRGLAVQQAQQFEFRRQQRLAVERRQNDVDAATPFMAEVTDPVEKITALLDSLINTSTKVQNVLAFHWLRVNAAAKAEIIDAVNQKFTDGQIANHRLAFKKALVNETLNKRLWALQEDDGLGDADRQDRVTQVVALIMEGKAQSYDDALNQVQDLAKIRQLGIADRPIDWEEAKKISSFIAKSKINDSSIAKFYYDFAQQCVDRGVGNSVEQNREYLARILEDRSTREDDRLSMETDAQGNFFKREVYAEKHLRALMGFPSFEHYLEAREKDKCKEIYEKEAELRKRNQRILADLRHLERDKYADKVTPIYNPVAQYRLGTDTKHLIDACLELEREYAIKPIRINFQYAYADPYLVYLLEADKQLPEHPITDAHLDIMANAMIGPLRAYALNHSVEVPNIDQSVMNIYSFLHQIKGPGDHEAAMRARMVRVFKNAIEGDAPLDQDRNLAIVRVGRLIAENEAGRCPDGVLRWITNYEMERIYKAPSDMPNMEFPLLVSALIAKEKYEFLAKHKPNTQSELATEGPALLIARMKCFGLLSPHVPVTYPGLAGTTRHTADIYNPVQALKRFYKGGEIAFDNRQDHYNYVEFEPFDANYLIKLVREEWLAGRLKREVIIDEVCKDWTLKQALQEIEKGDLKENKYFKYIDSEDPEALKEQFKPPLFKRLLCLHDYIRDPKELPFGR